MVKDLLANYDLEGKPQAEILDLLGPPETTSDSFAYRVGYMGWRREAPMVFDYTLIIRFQDGQVEAAYVQD